MNPRTPISYRPSIERKELETLITKRLRYKAINRFIDEAVKEKLNRELVVTSDPEMTKLLSKLTEVIHEHKGWKFMSPSKEVSDRIDKVAASIATAKEKPVRWMGSIDKTSATLRKKARRRP